jgi:hypothetical protein
MGREQRRKEKISGPRSQKGLPALFVIVEKLVSEISEKRGKEV